MKRVALLLCFIGISGILFIGAMEKQPRFDLATVAAISH